MLMYIGIAVASFIVLGVIDELLGGDKEYQRQLDEAFEKVRREHDDNIKR